MAVMIHGRYDLYDAERRTTKGLPEIVCPFVLIY